MQLAPCHRPQLRAVTKVADSLVVTSNHTPKKVMVDVNYFAQIAHKVSKERAKVKASTTVTATPSTSTPSHDNIKTSDDAAPST
jgi:ABC-type Zn uptake system ZnuABC Zn-binding protein ZnuA